eukprot:4966722-Prymnesium_polylepis.1
MPLDSLVGTNGRLGRHAARVVEGERQIVRRAADRAKADRCLPAPPTTSSTLTSARDARRRRRCDVDCLARSETAQAVRVRILVRVAAPVTHQPSSKASPTRNRPHLGAEKNYCP